MDTKIKRLIEAAESVVELSARWDMGEGCCCCGDDMGNHGEPMDCGHTPVDIGWYYGSKAINELKDAIKGLDKPQNPV